MIQAIHNFENKWQLSCKFSYTTIGNDHVICVTKWFYTYGNSYGNRMRKFKV